MDAMRCEHEGCQAAAVVGVGEPVEWVCLEHYEEFLAGVGEVIRKTKALFREGL